jgi:hypothetical protein
LSNKWKCDNIKTMLKEGFYVKEGHPCSDSNS